MSFFQKADGTVEGFYWYAGGTLTGTCSVDLEREQIVLHYRWSQRDNRSDTGSRDFGEGVFIIPAGYEMLYGYWYDRGELISSQTWGASRVSRDITDAVLASQPPYGNDLGLAVHGRDRIYKWDQEV